MTTALPALSNLSPAVAIHLTAAVLATALGLVALGPLKPQRPRLHPLQAMPVTLTVLAALSALFILQLGAAPGGLGPIHLLVPFALGTIVLSFRYLLQRQPHSHRRTMQACTSAAAWWRVRSPAAARLLESMAVGPWG